jgi:CubicO group peptidase (beta-lactamase class C family)
MPDIMLTTRSLVSFAVAASLALAQATQKVLKGNANPLDEDFKAFAEKALEKWHVPGVSVAVIDGDKTFAGVSIEPARHIYCLSVTREN